MGTSVRVSMHDGITKILSLDLGRETNIKELQKEAVAVAKAKSLIDAPHEIQVPENNPFREDLTKNPTEKPVS